MNRRQLAKNAFLGLCGALLGKKVKASVEDLVGAEVMVSTWGTDSNVTYHTYHITDTGECVKTVVQYPPHPAGSTEPVPPGWDFLNESEEDVYNGCISNPGPNR